jgi:hypothetical protein
MEDSPAYIQFAFTDSRQEVILQLGDSVSGHLKARGSAGG